MGVNTQEYAVIINTLDTPKTAPVAKRSPNRARCDVQHQPGVTNVTLPSPDRTMQYTTRTKAVLTTSCGTDGACKAAACLSQVVKEQLGDTSQHGHVRAQQALKGGDKTS